jgi:Polyketide cyclase / dehydrase and lipid transport
VRFELVTKASPEQVREALTDFSDRRLQIWDRTLDPSRYQLRELGGTWAVAREASPGSPFWVVLRYDWSDPAVVRWTVEESSYGGSGEGSTRIEPIDRGGSRLYVEWTSTGARGLQRPLIFLLHAGPLNRVIARMWCSALDRFADSTPG